jgi:hypothetical protein
MPRTLIFPHAASDHRGPWCIGLGLAVVLAAQAFPTLPLAAAIALIGSGATLALAEHHRYALLLPLNLCVYVALAALAITAELHAQITATFIDALLATAILIRALTYVIFLHRAH